jgi:hypothetical protein
MRCVPEQKNTRGIRMIIAALLIGGGILYALPHAAQAAGIRVISWLFDALTIGCIVAAVFLLVRYQMTGFQYIVRTKAEYDEIGLAAAYAVGAELNVADLPPETLDFVVIRSQGARPGVMECVLGVEQLVSAVPIRRRKADGVTKSALRDKYAAEGQEYVYYDYTVTFLADSALALVFIDGNRYVGVILEPDERMKAYFTQLKPGGINGSKM